MKKENIVYRDSGILFSETKEENSTTEWVDAKGNLLSEISLRKTNAV